MTDAVDSGLMSSLPPQKLPDVETAVLRRAWMFYATWPTGQYDEEAALCIEAELRRRGDTAMPVIPPGY